ncbi:MAG TPA: hypothetical protein VJS44_18760 [Pyrinomonadaceae bacterium]|nr:hypothetical protein [Pyrinomonadaceae bacterium]
MRIRYLLLAISFTLACSALASAQAVESVYTDFKNCKTLEQDDEAAGYLLEECRGVGGYKLRVRSQDDRQDIAVLTPNGTEHELNLGQIGGGGFSGLGEKVEWRVKREGGKIVPIALIVRFNVVTDPSTPEKSTSYLVVSKITSRQVCRIGEVDPGPNANQQARRMADGSAARPCVKPL